MRRIRLRLLAAAVLCGASGCTPAPPIATVSGIDFAIGHVHVESAGDTFLLVVDVAETEQQMRLGLKGRTHLPEDAGMLFLFDREQGPRDGFYMFRTYLPLSIAFLDADGTILALRDMAPCRSPIALFCRRYTPGGHYHAALEVNRGYFARRGIGIGDRVRCAADLAGSTPDGDEAHGGASPEPLRSSRAPGQPPRCAFPFSPALPERPLLHPSPGEP